MIIVTKKGISVNNVQSMLDFFACFVIPKNIMGIFRSQHYTNFFSKCGRVYIGYANIRKINYSKNKKKYTFRGLHYQTGRSAEDKLVVCVRGKIQDIFVNIQKDSKEYLKSSSEILDCKENKVLLVPRGFAHGFLTLKENTEVIYFSTNFYDPGKEKGIRWNDPRIKLVLKSKPRIISEKDKNINFLDS